MGLIYSLEVKGFTLTGNDKVWEASHVMSYTRLIQKMSAQQTQIKRKEMKQRERNSLLNQNALFKLTKLSKRPD